MLGRLCRTTLARRQPFLRPPQHQLRGLVIVRPPPSTLHAPTSALVRRLCSNGDKVPKGFGGFYKQRPKAPRAEEAGKEEAGEASEAGSGKASEASGDKGSAKASGSGGGSSGGGSGGGGGRRRRDDDGDGDPDGMFGGMQAQAAMAALAAVTLYASLQRSPSEAREVTFSDFRRELLESGNVDRIEIVNKTKARVYMRADVPGVPPPAPFYFTLGNVSGLEKKLEHAQEDLGVAPRDYVAVTYVSETSWGGELLKIAPTLLLIGFWVLMMRGFGGGAMGGGGGGGGGRNIFSVGKSKPTIISKEKKTGVTFKDVAGLAEAKTEARRRHRLPAASLPASLPLRRPPALSPAPPPRRSPRHPRPVAPLNR